ncbi:MAG: ABC-three component system protein [Deltaproteobacteria bacterium]
MSKSGLSPFSAADASLGYMYQVRSALLWSLRRQKIQPNFLVGIETLDDVTFETTCGNPTDLFQTKHHRTRTGYLTDASPDLWKSLRIWFEGHSSGAISTAANLYLVTTGTAPEGSAASFLRASPRDIPAAQSALDATASTSNNQTNAAAYKAYLDRSASDRTSIIERVVVLDAASNIEDLDAELRQEVYWASEKEHHSAFLDRLEGWWFRRVLQQLVDATADRIASVELEFQMSDLREQFKQEALPIDDDLLDFTLDEATIATHENSTFIQQLELVKAGKRRIAAAIRDYYRAFEQRSRWIRDDLIVGMDLHKYEKRLTEEWELVFEAMRDELGDAATDEAKEKAARSVLAWVERTTISIRPAVTEPFVSRGSFHMLSNEMRIGWHPEFRDRLALLFKVKGETA